MQLKGVMKSIYHYSFTILWGCWLLFQTNAVFAPPYGAFSSESTINPAIMQIDESQYLGARLQEDYVLVDVKGAEFTFGEIMGKPLILLLSYYGCDGTCPTLNLSLKKAISQMDRFEIGKDYQVLTVSFDKHDTAATMSDFVNRLGNIPAQMRAGWRHAVLKNTATDVDKFTASIGYKYFWSRADQIFLHPNVLILLTPEGRIARYLYGSAVDKDNLELALIDADWNRIANSTSVIDILAGVCYSYNFQEGKYNVNYPLFVGLASLLLGISLVGFSLFIFHLKRKKMRRLSHVQ